MSAYTLGGLTIRECYLSLPVSGVWTADVIAELDGTNLIQGAPAAGQVFVGSILNLIPSAYLSPSAVLSTTARGIVTAINSALSGVGGISPAEIQTLASSIATQYLLPNLSAAGAAAIASDLPALIQWILQPLNNQYASGQVIPITTQLTLGGGSLTGTILHSGVIYNQLHVRMTGGAGYLGAPALAQSFGQTSVPASLILASILGLTGTAFDAAESSSGVTGATLPAWTILGGTTAATELTRLVLGLAETLGPSLFWQLTDSGQVAIYDNADVPAGQSPLTSAALNVTDITDPDLTTLINYKPEQLEILAGIAGPCLAPGQIVTNIGGNTNVIGRASRVDYSFRQGRWRMKAWLATPFTASQGVR